MIIAVRLRLKDKHKAVLCRRARAVNFVWNFCNETQRKAVGYGRKWPSGYDLGKLCAGSSSDLGISARTIEAVAHQYERSRRQHRRPWLRWRSRKLSLGWVPFKERDVSFDGTSFKHFGLRFTPMHSRDILSADTKLRSGSFNQDSEGRWYINVAIEVVDGVDASPLTVGVDLGLKSLATMSDGSCVAAPRFYRTSEAALATSQRARKAKRTRRVHAKIRNRRRDFLHKASAKIAKSYGLIVVGDVSAKGIAQTRMAKSVLDAGWSDFKSMLSYKAIRHGGRMIEVSERFTSQVCSECGSLPASRPEGIADLGIREWACSDCGASHDRDVNAARNILRCGLAALVEGAPNDGEQSSSCWLSATSNTKAPTP